MKLLVQKKYVRCYCDFCGVSDDERKIVDGKHAFICDKCVLEAFALVRPIMVVSDLTATKGVE